MEKVIEKPNWVRGSCIGRGSFGTVNLAVDKFNGRVFAVKSVDRSSGLGCQIEALENEIRILQSISSPYVVEYLGDDVTIESGGAATTTASTSCQNLHMEYLPGGTVAELGKCSGTVDEMSLRSYVWCIVSALRYVHAKGIVHCDVKGRNVLVGSIPGSAKLADFGSAAEICTPIATPRGSPLWMAPEVVRGEYQGPESDVWSLGCTVIEMFTGKPAWEDRGADSILEIGYSGTLPKFPGQLSELGRDFLEKCLRRDPGERWSCDQLLQHPFLLPCSPDGISKWSPRCVFDWSDSNFSDQEEEEEVTGNSNFNGKGRIAKLATTGGANWESDGWLEVRNLITKTEVVETGTSLGFSSLMRTKKEKSSVNSDSIGNKGVNWRANWEYDSDSIASSSCTTPRETNSDHHCCSSGASRCATGSSCTNEAIISYSCYQIGVLLSLLLNFCVYYDYIFNDNIINKQSFTLKIMQLIGIGCTPSISHHTVSVHPSICIKIQK